MAFVLDVNLRIKQILGLQQAQSTLNKLQTQQQKQVAGGAGQTSSLTGAAKTQAAAATATTVALNKLSTANNKLTTSQAKAASSTQKASSAMSEGSRNAGSFGESVFLAGRRYSSFVAATAVPIAIFAGLKQATASVIEFDSAILQLRQIMGQTQEQIAGLSDSVLGFSVATGTSASEIGRVGKVLAQAGFRGDELKESLSTLAKVPLTPAFENINTAVEGSIAAINQFNKEGLTTTEVLDVMTALSNTFAASSEDIARGVARGGAAFEAIGGTYREFAAVFTTIRQATRESAETVGTFLKTISSRLADPRIVDFLEGKGIRIGEAIEAGNPVEAIKRIAAALQETASIQDRIEIGTRLGGRRQISRLLALVSNIDTLQDALGVAATSTGEFGKIAEEGLTGLQAQINVMIQQWNRLVQTLADPVFVPVINLVTQLGKSLATAVEFAEPIIPAFTYIVGFAGAFKLLTVAISNATKALALMNAAGQAVGGGLTAAVAGARGVAGGLAGSSARDRVQRRLAGGIGGQRQSTSGVVGGRLGGAARSQIGQLAIAGGIAIAAGNASDAFEEAGNSAGLFASEAVQAAAIVGVAISALSGKSITGALAALGPFGGTIAVATTALGSLAYAANRAAEVDMQGVVDELAKKVKDIRVEDVRIENVEDLEEQLINLGGEAIQGVKSASEEWENDWYDVFADVPARLKNLFTGQGAVTLNRGDIEEIVDTIVGSNPELLNEILESSIREFGAGGLEENLDQIFSESLGITAEYASLVRQSLLEQVGGLNKITNNISDLKLDAEASRLSNAIEQASRDFETLYVPSQISSQLITLSDAVGDTARAIQTNVNLFDTLSQSVGQDVGVPRVEGGFSRRAVEQLVASGDIGDLIDLSQFPELQGFASDLTNIGQSMDEFAKSIIKSKAFADDLQTALVDPQVDPFDIISEYVDLFVNQLPEDLPPEVVSVFRTSAENVGRQIKKAIEETAGAILDTEELQQSLQGILKNQRPFQEAVIDFYEQLINSQINQLNLELSGRELLARVDVNTSQLSDTILFSLQDALSNVGVDLDFPGLQSGFQNINDVIIDLAQNGDIVAEVIDRYKQSFKRHAELQRRVAEAQQTGEGASAGLFVAANKAAKEVLNLKVALNQLSRIAQEAPRALSEEQARRSGDRTPSGDRAAEDFSKRLSENAEQMQELISRERQFIEAQATIDVSQAFKDPADIFAESLKKSSEAVRAFTSALTTSDLQRGLSAPSLRTTQEGRVFVQRQEVPEAKPTEDRQIDRQFLQSALFGGEIDEVLNALREGAAGVLEGRAFGQLSLGRTDEAGRLQQLAASLREAEGSSREIINLIRDSGAGLEESARNAAEILREQAQQPGVREIEHIGALQRSIGDLQGSLQTLLERPEVAREPERIIDQLPSNIQNFLQNLEPVRPTVEPERESRVFQELSQSSSNISTGGANILQAGKFMSEASNQLRAAIDVQRESLSSQQVIDAGQNVSDTGSRDAVKETTDAVRSLNEKVDSVTKAVETQTKQAAELSNASRAQPLEIDGLSNNTEALSKNSETANHTQDSMSVLNDGVNRVAGAIENGVGVNVETMSNISVNVADVAAAAREFTSEFEAVATQVAKSEIRTVLQQLARASGNSEAAQTFESAIT